MDFYEFMDYVGNRLGDRPKIIDDLIFHLSGRQLSELNQRINEHEELEKKVTIPNKEEDEELIEMKKGIPLARFDTIYDSFCKLWGKDCLEDRVKGSYVHG